MRISTGYTLARQHGYRVPSRPGHHSLLFGKPSRSRGDRSQPGWHRIRHRYPGRSGDYLAGPYPQPGYGGIRSAEVGRNSLQIPVSPPPYLEGRHKWGLVGSLFGSTSFFNSMVSGYRFENPETNIMAVVLLVNGSLITPLVEEIKYRAVFLRFPAQEGQDHCLCGFVAGIYSLPRPVLRRSVPARIHGSFRWADRGASARRPGLRSYL